MSLKPKLFYRSPIPIYRLSTTYNLSPPKTHIPLLKKDDFGRYLPLILNT